jgi:adenosylhomocysteinase
VALVGCSGKTSVRKEDIHKIRHNSILVSASSKHEEFDLDAFNEECSYEDLSALVRRYTQKDQRVFYLLNKGAPINFRDHSILGFILDMVYSELFLCMKLISQKSLPCGLHLSPQTIHAEVGKIWIRSYSHEFAANQEDKIWGFPTTAMRGLTSTFHLQMQAVGKKE